jgi:APA family basic amino acid/polyamine antiporter
MSAVVRPSAVFTICYALVPGWIGLVVTAAVAVAATISMAIFCRGQFRRPTSYGVPLFPWVPAFSVMLNTFLLGQLDKMAYERFGIWTAVVTGEGGWDREMGG